MRADIEKYLGTVDEATAKQIADKIGVDRLHVARELNQMKSSGLVEREMKTGKMKSAGEYVYWLSNSKAKPMDKTSTVVVHEPYMQAPTKAEKELREQNIALQDQLRITREVLEAEKAAHAKTRASISTNSDDRSASLRADLEREKEAHALNVAELNKVIEKLDASERSAKELRARCASLQVQIDQYDERKRFDTWFNSRPENTGQPSIVKEAMWDSWLERSKMIEVAA